MGAKSAKIGLDQLHYATVTADTEAALTYGTVVSFPGVMTAKVTSENNQATQYDDNGLAEVAYSRGKITIELKVRDLDLDTHAALLGHTITAGVMVSNAGDTPPYVALGFRAKKANGKYRYKWLLKGQFVEPDDESETLGEKIAFQNATIKGTFAKTEHNGDIERTTDEDATGFVAATATAWFSSPASS